MDLAEYSQKHLSSKKVSDKAVSYVWRTSTKKPEIGRAIAANPNLRDKKTREELSQSSDTKTREVFATRGDLNGVETDLILSDKKASVVGKWCWTHEASEEQLEELLKTYRKEVTLGLLGSGGAKEEEEEDTHEFYGWEDDGYGVVQITRTPPMHPGLLAHAVTLLALDRKTAGEYQNLVEQYVAGATPEAAAEALGIMRSLDQYKAAGAASRTDNSKVEAVRLLSNAWKEESDSKQQAGLILGLGLAEALGRAAKSNVAETLLKDMKNSLGTGNGPNWEKTGLKEALTGLIAGLDAPLRAEFAGVMPEDEAELEGETPLEILAGGHSFENKAKALAELLSEPMDQAIVLEALVKVRDNDIILARAQGYMGPERGYDIACAWLAGNKAASSRWLIEGMAAACKYEPNAKMAEFLRLMELTRGGLVLDNISPQAGVMLPLEWTGVSSVADNPMLLDQYIINLANLAGEGYDPGAVNAAGMALAGTEDTGSSVSSLCESVREVVKSSQKSEAFKEVQAKLVTQEAEEAPKLQKPTRVLPQAPAVEANEDGPDLAMFM